MTEKNLAQENDPLSYEAAADNLSYFLDESGIDPEITSDYDCQVMASVPLMVQLEPLRTSLGTHSERDKLVSYFEANDWLPKQLQEANIAAIKGVDETLRRASHTSQGDKTEAQKNTHDAVKRYYLDSLHDVKTLNLVRTRREGQQMIPNIGSLRVTRPALYTIADMLLAREFLDKTQWANSNWAQYTHRQKYWRGFMLFAAQYGKDKVLNDAFNHFYEKAQNRRKFWSEEFGKMDRKIGHLVSEGLKQEVGSVAEAETTTIAGEPVDWDKMIPEGARQDLERAIAQYADKDAQIDRYVNDQGITQARAEEMVLGGRALRYNGHVVGVENKEEATSASPHTARPKQAGRRRPSYRARYKDTTDFVVREQKPSPAPDETSGPEAPSP